MLAKVVLSDKIGGIHWNITDGGSYIINPNRIKDLKVWDTNKSEFLYAFCPEDDKGDRATFRSTTTVANLIIAADASVDSKVIGLKVYEDDDTTSAAVVHYFQVKDIVLIEGYGDYMSWAHIAQGGDRVTRFLLDYNLDQIIDVASTGTTTTTTTTTTTV